MGLDAVLAVGSPESRSISKHSPRARDVPEIVIGVMETRRNRENGKHALGVGILPCLSLYLGPEPLLLG